MVSHTHLLDQKTKQNNPPQKKKKKFCFLPDTVEDVPIRIYPQHDVLHGCVMDERALRVDEEHIRNPDLLDQTGIEGPTLVAAGGEGQPVVLPVMPQVQRHGEILETREPKTKEQTAQAQKSGRAGATLGMSAAPTMLTSDMLSMLSTWTSTPTGRAEPTKGQTVSNISILHKSSVCTSGRDYALVNPAVEL